MDNRVPFKIVRGPEQAIMESYTEPNHTYPDGTVYFATDTRKIYYSDGTTSLTSMGGNSGVWYGQMEYTETPEEGQVNFDFHPDEIEGDMLPNIDDLIFNSPDKSFYRVMDVEGTGGDSVIKCRRLAVSGSGGGGSGGGESSSAGRLTLSRIGDQTINILQGGDCFIKFKYIAVDGSGEDTGPGHGTLYVGNVIVSTFAVAQGENTINVKEYLSTPDTYSIRLVVSGSVGTSVDDTATKIWTVIVNNLELKWPYDETAINNVNEPLPLNWTVSTGLNYTTHLLIDDIYPVTIAKQGSAREQNYTIQDMTSIGLIHGAHQVEMYVIATVGGQEHRSNSIYHNLICVDNDRSDTIISVNLQTTAMRQYDTLTIPIIVYNPVSNDGKVTISLRENSIEKDTWIDYNNGESYVWNYTPTEAGLKTLTVASGGIEKNITLLVEDIGVSISEIEGYNFKFKASDITSNNALQNWSFNNAGVIKPSFSTNFDWVNGGLKTESDNTGGLRNYINIKAGTSMSFNFKPFANVSKTTGYTLKVIFKATNCRLYDATLFTIGSSRLNDSIYLQLTANEGQYKSGTSTLSVPYCENSYIEFEIDIGPYTTTNVMGQQQPVNISYITSWLDGVPASITNYAANDNFTQNNPRDIVIGSNDCDVQLYMIKCYPKHLTDEQHLTNFIIDAPNANEMIARYRRNDILDDSGEISYRKLAEKNPNCDVYLYDIPRMTLNKSDKVTGCTYTRYRGSGEPQQIANNVTISVQGTSSAAYGLAAFNLDSNFTEGFTDFSNSAEGEVISKWSMTPHSFPVNYLNTKVNVASCEQTNNAINQEWYDRYEPFETEYHYKMRTQENNPYLPRNTIEFPTMGVVFIRDHNQATDHGGEQGKENNVFCDTEGYIPNPYYKLYSICNMGNSKKNKEIFTDPDNPYEVIMEVSDNQYPQQWMTSTEGLIRDNTAEEFTIQVYDKDNKLINVPIFEWRNKPKSSKMVEANNAWLDLVTWFATNNPSAATGEELPAPVTFAPYTFKGYTSTISGYEPEGQVLKGTTISTYAGQYTHDTYEYRMAKMLSECEDHLIMDAVVFHYLFIERHCLIDNVAKNTFWHTADFQHWSMIKDYDNDTADGNDNSGHLTLTYGYEVLDHVHHNENESMVFNASPSVWLHFIDGLLDARATMYRALDNKITSRDTSTIHGAWKAQPYLEEFEKWQSALPERVWIETYYRLYKRPLEVYGDATFLPRLEGGKKTHQRKQFETYQQEYMASEYYGSECSSSKIDIRANGSDIQNHIFPMTMYADSYIRIAPGTGQNAIVRIRAKRGEVVNVQLPVSDANDMTTYFYSAHYITSLTNIAALKPKSINLAGATRLREFSAGSLEEGWHNDNLETATFGNNTMLERLEVQNCPKISNSLDLSSATGLKYLDIRGSGFTGIDIADNAPVETLYLNNPSSLYLSNLHNIKNFSIDYGNLESLYLNNIDDNIGINSQTLVTNTANNYKPVEVADEEVFNSGKYYIKNGNNYEVATSYSSSVQYYKQTFSFYGLQNINWTFDDPNDIDNNKIKLLETIYDTDGPREVTGLHNATNSNLALTGTAAITANAYNSASSIDIYNRYAIDKQNGSTRFANLDLNFLGDQAQLCTISILDGNHNVVWHKKAVGAYTINDAFLANGVEGAIDYNKITTKIDSAAETFTFAEQWQVLNADNTVIDTINGSTITYTPAAADRKQITIMPVFIAAPRKYSITFNLQNGNEPIVEEVTYNTPALNVAPTGIHKDDLTLPFNETYAFIGWGLREDSINVITNSVLVQSDMNLYAIYNQVDVRKNVYPELFRYTVTDGESENGYAPVILYPKEKGLLKGKITIPTFIDHHPVVALGNFSITSTADPQPDPITHIFFEDASISRVQTINSGCFNRMSTLKYFEYPTHLTTIGSSAFAQTALQIDLVPNEIRTYTIGNSNLTTIGYFAFQNALVSESSDYNIKIPSSVTSIGFAAFGWEDGCRNCTIILGTENDPSQWNAQLNPSYNNNCYNPTTGNEGTGHRFSQNYSDIKLIFYSANYSRKTDLIPIRDTSSYTDDPNFTILDAIHSPRSHLSLETNLLD